MRNKEVLVYGKEEKTSIMMKDIKVTQKLNGKGLGWSNMKHVSKTLHQNVTNSYEDPHSYE